MLGYRIEFEHLKDILDARALDSSVGDTLKRSQADYSEQVTAQDKLGTIADMPVLENGCENHRIVGVNSTFVVRSRVCCIDV